MARILNSSLILFLLSSCGLPRDPEGATKRIQSAHELRVGIADNPPWTIAGPGEPTGIEADLVRRFARNQHALVVWTKGSETTLAEALKHHELDLMVGGFDAKTPWASSAAISQPFAETGDKKKHVFLAAPGENQLIVALDEFLIAQKRAKS